jgi:hypothetical protein
MTNLYPNIPGIFPKRVSGVSVNGVRPEKRKSQTPRSNFFRLGPFYLQNEIVLIGIFSLAITACHEWFDKLTTGPVEWVPVVDKHIFQIKLINWNKPRRRAKRSFHGLTLV